MKEGTRIIFSANRGTGKNKHFKTISGVRPLCFFDKAIVVSKKNKILMSDYEMKNYRFMAELPDGIIKRIAYNSRILSRVLRNGPNNAIAIGNQELLVSSNGHLYRIKFEKEQCTINCEHDFRKEMRNTLSLAQINNISSFDNLICYGEYFNNPNKKKVNIWSNTTSENSWRIVHTFEEGLIEHVHAIIPDHIRDVVWILTGDFDDSAGFWIARNNFKNVEPVVKGKQKFRACVAFPIPEGLLYATDSQFELNSIRLLKNKDNQWSSEYFYPLEGSCINACQLGDDFVFSTVVEPGEEKDSFIINLLDHKPGPGIKSLNSEIVVGNCQKGFQNIGKWAKDCFPLRLCQFGTIVFPTGFNPTNNIYGYGIGLKGLDGKACIIER